jgi:hypothetical protein
MRCEFRKNVKIDERGERRYDEDVICEKQGSTEYIDRPGRLFHMLLWLCGRGVFVLEIS